MRQIACSGAVGWGCVFSPGSQTSAAEWSLAQMYTAGVDYDSNRRLTVDPQGSESGLLTADLRFNHVGDDTSFYVQPRYTLRRYSDALLFGNGDDRSLEAGFVLNGESTKLDLTASIMERSTLISELLETGIVEGNTRQLMAQLGGDWTWTQSERRQLIGHLGYSDVSYRGEGSSRLAGYRSPSGNLGERFIFSEVGSVTFSVYGSQLSSDVQGGSSHQLGVEGELIYSLSDRTRFDGTFGESSRLLSGVNSTGSDISATLTHDLSSALGNVVLAYTRTLVPYGIGFLVERRQISLSASRQLSEYVTVSGSYQHVDNDERTALLGIDRRRYDNIVTSVSWRLAETWILGAEVAALRTVPPGFVPGTVNEWRSVVNLTWTPPLRVGSR